MIKKCLYRLSGLLLGVATLAGSLTSCQDDEFPYPSGPLTANTVKATLNSNTSSGLVQNEDGTWTATRRVPLVGAGRIVDNVAPGLITVAAWTDEAEKLLDTDLTNTFAPSTAVAEIGLFADQIVSIRDLNHTYAGGQKAGFVFKKSGNAINLELFQGYWLSTFLKGEEQEKKSFTEITGLLDLGLGNITGGTAEQLFVVESTFEKPFDEIRVGNDGIADVNVADVTSIYYGYIGENPIIPAVNNSSGLSQEYFGDTEVWTPTGASWAGGYIDHSLRKLVDNNLDNGVAVGGFLIDLFQPRVTVDFGKEIPAGSEVGFYITQGSFLNLDIAGATRLSAYDANGNETNDSYHEVNVGNLGVAKGGDMYFGMKLSEPCHRIKIEFDGVSVDLGATEAHYAYVREPITVDPSSYFDLADATVYTPTYRFADVDETKGKITKFIILDQPNGSKIVQEDLKQNQYGEWILSNMDVAGDYIVQGTYQDYETGESYVRTATITRLVRNQSTCGNIYLTNDEGSTKYEAYVPDDDFKGLIVIGGSSVDQKIENLVDSDIANSLDFRNNNIINLATNQCYVGVKTTDGSKISNGKKLRVGFVIERSTDFLKTDVLNFFRIQLKNNGEDVFSNVAQNNNGVSLSLIDGGNEGLARLGIEVDTDVEFDAIELYTSGLTSLNLASTLKIYYAFCEVATDNCGDPGEECMQLITNANYGAIVSYGYNSAAQVAGNTEGLSNIVDGDMNSYCDLSELLNVGENVLTVTFDKIRPGQEIGFILSSITGVASVNLIKVTQIKTLDQNGKVLQSSESGGALELKVAGSGDKSYISIIPAKGSDDVYGLKLSFVNVATVLDIIHVNGVYIRPDYDGDGVMDCVTDPLTTDITDLRLLPADICQGNDVTLKVNGGEEDVDYTLRITDYQLTKNTPYDETFKVRIDPSTWSFTFPEGNNPIPNLEPGVYYLTVPNTDAAAPPFIGNVILTVHPHETTWTGSKSTDWNDWGNWTTGVPWDCTNVIIPSPSGSPTYNGNVTHYPSITANDNAWCQYIHFEPDAQLIGQQHLNYIKAYVDMKITPGSYNLLSTPLKDMVTGDMFILDNVSSPSYRSDWTNWRIQDAENNGIHENYFTELNSTSTDHPYTENRVNPLIYQRFWSAVVENRTLTRAADAVHDDEGNLLFTDWSRSFNAVATAYDPGQGFALKVDKQNDNDHTGDYIFHFPKSHQTYHYYDINGNSLGQEEGIFRLDEEIGRFIIDQLPWTVDLYRETGNNTKFLFGNPLMAPIYIAQLFELNSHITSIDVYRNGKYVTISRNGDSSDGSENITTIAPMEAVFITIDESSNYYTVNLAEDLMIQKTFSNVSFDQLNLTVAAHGHTASCSVIPSASASDDYDVREDASLLVGSEEGSGVAVFTVAGGKALSIQRISQATRIPVGFYLREPGSVRLSFQAKDAYWDGWHLTDTRTGQTYPLDAAVTLEDVSTGSGRFFLEKAQ